jgi:hypothetical protein
MSIVAALLEVRMKGRFAGAQRAILWHLGGPLFSTYSPGDVLF